MNKTVYKYNSTSSSSATIEDIEFSKTSTTRRLIRPTIVNNSKDPNASVTIELIHQRAGKGHSKRFRLINFLNTKLKI